MLNQVDVTAIRIFTTIICATLIISTLISLPVQSTPIFSLNQVDEGWVDPINLHSGEGQILCGPVMKQDSENNLRVVWDENHSLYIGSYNRTGSKLHTPILLGSNFQECPRFNFKILENHSVIFVLAKEYQISQFIINSTLITLNGSIMYETEFVLNGTIDVLQIATGYNDSMHLVWDSQVDSVINYTMWLPNQGWGNIIQLYNWTYNFNHSVFFPYTSDKTEHSISPGSLEVSGWRWSDWPGPNPTLSMRTTGWPIFGISSNPPPEYHKHNPYHSGEHGKSSVYKEEENELPLYQTPYEKWRLISYVTEQKPKRAVAWFAGVRHSLMTEYLIPNNDNYTEIAFHNIHFEPSLFTIESTEIATLRVVYSARDPINSTSNIFMNGTYIEQLPVPPKHIPERKVWPIGWKLTDEGNATLPSLAYGNDQHYYLTYLAADNPSDPIGTWSIRMRYTGIVPDLAILPGGITFNVESVLESNEVVIRVNVTNLGAKGLAWTNLTITANDQILPDVLVPPLKHGETTTVHITWIVHGDGEIQVSAHADSTNLYMEDNEKNNWANNTLTVVHLIKSSPSFAFGLYQISLGVVLLAMASVWMKRKLA